MPGEPLRHRIRRKLPQWRAAGAPPHVLKWIEEGAACEWITGPPPPYNYGVSCTDVPTDQRRWFDGEMRRLLAMGAIEPAPPEERTHNV